MDQAVSADHFISPSNYTPISACITMSVHYIMSTGSPVSKGDSSYVFVVPNTYLKPIREQSKVIELMLNRKIGQLDKNWPHVLYCIVMRRGQTSY
jgi:hypothetical protein